MTARLRVDWPACEGRGLCHELAPDLVDLDPWGFPVLSAEVPDEHLAQARQAVWKCPRLALRLLEA